MSKKRGYSFMQHFFSLSRFVLSPHTYFSHGAGEVNNKVEESIRLLCGNLSFTWRISSRDDSTRDEIVQRVHAMIRPGMSGTRSR